MTEKTFGLVKDKVSPGIEDKTLTVLGKEGLGKNALLKGKYGEKCENGF